MAPIAPVSGGTASQYLDGALVVRPVSNGLNKPTR